MAKERLARCAACGERAPTSAAYCPSCGAPNGRAAWVAASATRLTAGGLVIASVAVGDALLGAARDHWLVAPRPFLLALGALSTLAWLAVPIGAGVAAALCVRASGATRFAARAGWALAALALTAVALAAGGAGELWFDAITGARLGLAAVFAALGATVAISALGRVARVAPFSWVARTATPAGASGRFAFALVAVALVTVLVPWLVAWIAAADVAASLGRELARVRSAGAAARARGQEAS